MRTDVVLLAAGLSSRMGKTNKLLLPVKTASGEMPMCAYCAMQALDYLESRKDGGCLIVVTGYRHRETERSLRVCADRIKASSSPVQMITVVNTEYRKGQFNSTKKGVLSVNENTPFFISLADMPDIRAANYSRLESLYTDQDAVRPFYKAMPGHPVLHAPSLRQRILDMPDSASVRELLLSCNTLNVQTEDPSYASDVDCQTDWENRQAR